VEDHLGALGLQRDSARRTDSPARTGQQDAAICEFHELAPPRFT
jgi:hypothetical protein